MGERKNRSFGAFLLQIALILYFAASGYNTIRYPGSGDIHSAVRYFASGNMADVIVIILGVLEMISALYLLLSFFLHIGSVGRFFIAFILIMWIFIVVLVDVFGSGGILNGAFSGSFNNALSFLRFFSVHLMVLGGLIIVR